MTVARRLLPVLLLLLSACASPVWRSPDRPAACVDWYAQLDGAIRAAATGYAPYHRLPDFPYLRSDRFLASLTPSLATDEQWTFWQELANRRDLEARILEWRNLPLAVPQRRELTETGLRRQLDRCSAQLLAADRRQSGFREALRQQAVVPDDYRTLYRFPLYPLAAVPVSLLTERARDDFRRWFATPWDRLPVRGRLVRFSPPPQPRLSAAARRRLLQRMAANPLDLPVPTPDEAARLFAALAPELVVDVAADFDRFGAVAGEEDGWRIRTDQPTVYHYLSWTWLDGHPALQLNYSLWFSARAGSAPRIEQGPLDGLTLRITLDRTGEVRLVDGMNNCGCYHFFLPTAALVPRERSPVLAPGPFIPAPLPADFPRQPLLIRISSGWHQVQQVATDAPPAAGQRSYRLRPYTDLESLPLPSGRFVSLFRPDGIARHSGRIEPLLLFPMGVANVGSMRQRGHHPIVLIGREHFDSPDLLERHFCQP